MGMPIPHPQSTTNFYFPVKLAPVQAVIDQWRIPSDYQAIVRVDTEQVLGLCRKGSYKLLSNEEAFTSLEESLVESDLDLNGIQVEDSLSYNGGLSIRAYTFPAHSRDIGRFKDDVLLRLQCINSFNLSASFQMQISAFRQVCSNGMVMLIRPMTRITMRHSRRLDIKAMAKRLTGILNVYDEQIQQWREWSTIRLAESDVDRLFKTFPQMNPRLEKGLREQFAKEIDHFGHPTAYAFLNALTYYATHAPVRASAKSQQAAIVLQRENKVRAVLNSPLWRELTR